MVAHRAAADGDGGDLPPQAPQHAVATFGLLASTMRLHIVWLLAQGEKDVGTLAERTGDALAARRPAPGQAETGWPGAVPAGGPPPGLPIAGMDAPASMVALTVADELVVHGWDVASAMRRSYRCEPELLDAAQSFLVQFFSPDPPAGPDVPFGPSRQLTDDAPLLDRVVALAGRPGWSSG